MEPIIMIISVVFAFALLFWYEGNAHFNIKRYALLLLVFVIVSFSWAIFAPREIEIRKIQTIVVADTGEELNGYFKGTDTFVVLPRKADKLKITHPRWGSVGNVKYEPIFKDK